MMFESLISSFQNCLFKDEIVIKYISVIASKTYYCFQLKCFLGTTLLKQWFWMK